MHNNLYSTIKITLIFIPESDTKLKPDDNAWLVTCSNEANLEYYKRNYTAPSLPKIKKKYYKNKDKK